MPYDTPTVSSAIKASINDENKRQKKAENTGTRADKQQLTANSAKVFGTTVIKKNKEEKPYNPAKYGGTAGHSSSLQDDGGFSGRNKRGGSSSEAQEKKEYLNRAGAGGSTSRDIVNERYKKPTSHVTDYGYQKIPKPVFNSNDQYGYKELSAAEAKLHRENEKFYKNEIRSRPLPGHKIEDMLKWKGDYGMLERNHLYIQWLFPIPESNGLNMSAQQLYEHEAKAIREDDGAQKRLLKAYSMMLDFYGMKLVDSIEGKVKRLSKGWEDRYDHLNRSRHNLLRITRILKSIGELGYERFQARWVEFLIDEAVINKVLPNLNGQCLMHWVMAVKDDGEREMLYRKANGLPIDQDNTHYGVNSESEDEGDDNDIETDSFDGLNLQTETDKPKQNLYENEKERTDVKQFKHGDIPLVSQCKDKGDSMKVVPLSKPQMVKPNNDINEQPELSEASASSVRSTVAGTTKGSSLGAIPKIGYHCTRQENDGFHERSIDVTSTGDKITAGTTPLPCDNLKFYQNNLLSRPAPGYVIETILNYKGEYDFFDEKYPAFMQWLFPIPGSTGRNTEAQPLHEHEAKEIRNNDELNSRVLRAFRMMLDYFGMDLYNDISGKFRKNKKTYKKRYYHLEKNQANFLRITRIIKSIGELGFERFQVPWIDFLISEGIDNDHFPILDGRIIEYWIGAIKDEAEKHTMFVKYKKELQHRVSPQSEETMEDDNLDYDFHFDSENIERNSPLFASAELGRWIP